MTPKRVTLKDVATAAGVSPTTASHALNGKGRVDVATRERVAQAARRLGYVPDPRARALRVGRAQTLAFVSSISAEDTGLAEQLAYFTATAAAAAQEALRAGYALVLVPPMAQSSWVASVVMDGAVVAHPLAGDPLLGILERRGLPVVTIGWDVDATAPPPWVAPDADEAVRLVYDHLLERGCRAPALMVATERRSFSVELHRAYLAWATARRVEPIVVEASQRAGEAAARAAFQRLLVERPDVDAVFAPLDANGAGCLAACVASGRAVPGDVRVVTTDGTWARRSSPPLTALDLHPERLAVDAVATLVAALAGGGPPAGTLVPPSLVVRDST